MKKFRKVDGNYVFFGVEHLCGYETARVDHNGKKVRVIRARIDYGDGVQTIDLSYGLRKFASILNGTKLARAKTVSAA